MEGAILKEFLDWLLKNYPELMTRPTTTKKGPPADLNGAVIDDNQAAPVDNPVDTTTISSTTSTPCRSPKKKRSKLAQPPRAELTEVKEQEVEHNHTQPLIDTVVVDDEENIVLPVFVEVAGDAGEERSDDCDEGCYSRRGTANYR